MEQASRPKSYENWLVVIFAFGTGIAMFDRNVIAFLFPVLVPELGLQMWQVGAIGSSLSIAWAISAWVLGSVSDYKGRRPVLLPAVFLFSIISWLTGITSNFIQMVIVRGLMGFAEGPVYSIQLATMAEESSPHRRGFNMGANMFFGPIIGFALGPIIAVQLASSVGWRWTFFIVGIPGILLGLVLWKFLREPGSVLHRRMAAARGESTGDKVKYLDVLKYRNVWVSSLYMVLMVNFLMVFAMFGMLYLTTTLKLAMADAAMSFAGLGVGASIGMITLPGFSDRVGRRPVLVIAGILAGLSLLAFASVGANMALLFLSLVVGGFFSSSMALSGGTVPAESVPFRFAATAIAIAGFFGEILGATLMPVIAGGLADAYGLSVPIYVAAAGGILAGIAGLFIAETAPKILAQRAARGGVAMSGAQAD